MILRRVAEGAAEWQLEEAPLRRVRRWNYDARMHILVIGGTFTGKSNLVQDGSGGLVGPQLDGIGNRGLERLVEDVLDPNRNVDRAFRTHLLTLKNGDVITVGPARLRFESTGLA